MKSSCISWPENEPLVLIRTSGLALCEGNHCAAALLSFFEHCHNNKLEHRPQAEHANEIAERHGERGMQDTSLLQWHTEKEFEERLLKLYSRKTIRKGIQKLIEKEFITLHENPNSRYRFDKTHYFLFHPENVIKALSSQSFDISDEVKIPHREGQNAARSGKNASPSGKIAAPITKISSEISSQDLTPSTVPPAVAPHVERNGVYGHDSTARLFNQELKNQAKVVLAYLNQVTKINYKKLTLIEAILDAGYTVEECKMVIDWWDKVWTVNRPDQRDLFDDKTPFKRDNFETYLPKAQKWHANNRQTVTPSQPYTLQM